MPQWFTPDMQKLLIALLIGAVIGAEREYRTKSAGLRTIILVCTGSCLFTIMSLHIGGASNPDRIASNIVTGIGFLGAGVIFKGDDIVTGITTATAIWAVAALGMAVGAGYLTLSYFLTAVIFLVLTLALYVQRIIERTNELHNYRIVCSFKKETLDKYEKLFKECRLKALRGAQSKAGDIITGHWLVQGSKKHHEKFIQILLNDDEVSEFDF